jgi:hypothetical protein
MFHHVAVIRFDVLEEHSATLIGVTRIGELGTELACVQMGGRRRTHIGYWLEREGKRPLGRPRHQWVDNIKVDSVEIRLGGLDQIGLAQDRGR